VVVSFLVFRLPTPPNALFSPASPHTPHPYFQYAYITSSPPPTPTHPHTHPNTKQRAPRLSPEERSFQEFEAAMQASQRQMEEALRAAVKKGEGEEEEEEEDSKEEDSKEEEGEEKEGGGEDGGWAAREAAWKRAMLAEKGPYLYELFAVLIHSGSALGAWCDVRVVVVCWACVCACGCGVMWVWVWVGGWVGREKGGWWLGSIVCT
jgi:hypothetical protein